MQYYTNTSDNYVKRAFILTNKPRKLSGFFPAALLTCNEPQISLSGQQHLCIYKRTSKKYYFSESQNHKITYTHLKLNFSKPFGNNILEIEYYITFAANTKFIFELLKFVNIKGKINNLYQLMYILPFEIKYPNYKLSFVKSTKIIINTECESSTGEVVHRT